MASVTRTKAQKVLKAVQELFPGQEESFTLYDAEHEEMSRGTWAISAEGVADVNDCWPMTVVEEAFRNRANRGHVLNSVFLEPRTSWSLGIYPVE